MDIVSTTKRSEMMSNIKSRNTQPELLVRRYLHGKGFRYRLNQKISGFRPDIVLRKYKTCIFIHGCFWHRHEGCKLASTPKSNSEFWEKKLEALKSYDLEIRKDPHSRSYEGIKTLAKLRGSQSGLSMAEAFEVVRKIER